MVKYKVVPLETIPKVRCGGFEIEVYTPKSIFRNYPTRRALDKKAAELGLEVTDNEIYYKALYQFPPGFPVKIANVKRLINV